MISIATASETPAFLSSEVAVRRSEWNEIALTVRRRDRPCSGAFSSRCLSRRALARDRRPRGDRRIAGRVGSRPIRRRRARATQETVGPTDRPTPASSRGAPAAARRWGFPFADPPCRSRSGCSTADLILGGRSGRSTARCGSAMSSGRRSCKKALPGRLVPQDPSDEPASGRIARLWGKYVIA